LSNTAKISKIKVSFVFLDILSRQATKAEKSNLEAIKKTTTYRIGLKKRQL
jgi:hypothetical protein